MDYKKKGFITISDEMYNRHYDELCIIFAKFQPFKIEFRFWQNKTWYLYGISDMFDSVEEYIEPPQYDVLFTRSSEGDASFKFQRVKQYPCQ